jgi:CNT family concentrative nucleoside transporter
MASVSGGVLAAYVGLLQDKIPGIAGHLLVASILSAPASLVLAKILFPAWPEYPKEDPNLKQNMAPAIAQGMPEDQAQEPEIQAANFIEALAKGAQDGVKLAVNVSAMLLAFIAFIALINGVLGWVSGVFGLAMPLSLQAILGFLFAPLSLLLGISWPESQLAGQLLGEKLVLNEFVAFLSLSQNFSELSERSQIILSYALCGFANFSSIAIQIGGIGSLVPARRSEIASLGLRALLGGTLASLMTAAFVSLLL